MTKVEGDAGITNWLGIVAEEDVGVIIVVLVVDAVVGEGIAKG